MRSAYMRHTSGNAGQRLQHQYRSFNKVHNLPEPFAGLNNPIVLSEMLDVAAVISQTTANEEQDMVSCSIAGCSYMSASAVC